MNREEKAMYEIEEFKLNEVSKKTINTLEESVNALVDGVDNGTINPLDVFASFDRMAKILTEGKKKVDVSALEEAVKYGDKTFDYRGVKFTFKNGSKALQYKEDEVVQELEDKLKERKDLVKLATNSKDMIFDSDGIEVPKVSVKHGKDSLSVKF